MKTTTATLVGRISPCYSPLKPFFRRALTLATDWLIIFLGLLLLDRFPTGLSKFSHPRHSRHLILAERITCSQRWSGFWQVLTHFSLIRLATRVLSHANSRLSDCDGNQWNSFSVLRRQNMMWIYAPFWACWIPWLMHHILGRCEFHITMSNFLDRVDTKTEILATPGMRQRKIKLILGFSDSKRFDGRE